MNIFISPNNLTKKRKDKFVDCNIEYTHIYSDKEFGDEQIASINKTKEVIKDLKKNKKTYSLIALIDDYHPDKNEFDQSKFICDLKSHGLAPDYIALESRLVDYKEDILNLLPHREAKKHSKYFEKREKINCSFLIVGWYFLRLGLLAPKEKTLINVSKRGLSPFGRDIINVLDGKYVHSEDGVYRIIEKTIFKQNIDRIKNVFY